MTIMRNIAIACLAGLMSVVCAAQPSPAPQKQPVTPQQSGFMQGARELVGPKGEGGIQPPTHGTRQHQAKKKKKPQNQQRSQQQQAALKAQQQRQALTAAELQKSTVQARTQETGTPAARAQPAPPPKPPRPSVPGR